MTYAKLATAKTFLLGPILDTDGAAKTDEVVASIKVTKNGTVGAVDAQDTLTHNHTGHYVFVSDGGDFDTLGEVEFTLNSGTNAMAPVKFQVLPATTYDAIITNAAGGADGLALSGASKKVLVSTCDTVTALANNAITAASINADAITADKIADDAIGNEHWNVSAVAGCAVSSIGNDVITAASIQADAIDFATFAADCKTGTGLKANVESVTAGAITAAAIATNAIDDDAIAADVTAVIATAVWNAATASYGGAGTYGQAVEDTLADTNELQTDDTPGALAALESHGDSTWATATGFSTLSASDVEDAVWDADLGDHEVADSAGEALAAAGTAGDPWLTELPGSYAAGSAGYIIGGFSGANDPWGVEIPGAYGAGTAGKIVGDNLNATVSSRSSHSAADVWAVATRVLTANTNLNDPTAATIADAVWDEAATGHTDAGKAGAQMWTDIDAILDDTDLIDDGTSGLAKIATDVAAILVDTAVIGVAGAGLTAVPWNAAWDAEVQSECTDALNAYDPPTNAEMEARTLAAAAYATAANQSTIIGYIDTEVAAILAAVDTEVAAIKAKTDNLPTDPADQSAVEAAITAATSGLATAAALATVDGIVDDILVDTGTTLDALLKRVAVVCIGDVTQAGTAEEIFVYGSPAVTATVTVDEDGNRSIAWS